MSYPVQFGFTNKLIKQAQRGGSEKKGRGSEKLGSEQAQKQTDVPGGVKATALSLSELS